MKFGPIYYLYATVTLTSQHLPATESMLQNPSFEFQPHVTPRDPSFEMDGIHFLLALKWIHAGRVPR